MSSSFTRSTTTTFTLTHAKKLASKVATDLKRIQRFYGSPSDSMIADYEEEITAYLKEDYLEIATYGFKRNGKWIEPTLEYAAEELRGRSVSDDNPGKVRPGADISGAIFGSYFMHSQSWFSLSQSEKEDFASDLPINRVTGSKPGIEGHFTSDKTYSAGDRALNRKSVRS